MSSLTVGRSVWIHDGSAVVGEDGVGSAAAAGAAAAGAAAAGAVGAGGVGAAAVSSTIPTESAAVATAVATAIATAVATVATAAVGRRGSGRKHSSDVLQAVLSLADEGSVYQPLLPAGAKDEHAVPVASQWMRVSGWMGG